MEKASKMIKGKTKLIIKNSPPEDVNNQPEIVENVVNFDAENGEQMENKIIINSYGTFQDSGPLKIRMRAGREMKNTSKFLLNTILKMYYISLWKRQIKVIKYAQRGYNAQRANFKILVKNLSTVINNFQYNYLNEIFEKMKKNSMPSEIKHNKNYGKLKIVDNDIMDKKCLEKFLLWSDLLPKKLGQKISKILIELFNKTSQNNNPKIITNKIYIKSKNVKNDNNNYNYKYIPRYERIRYDNYILSPDNPRIIRQSPIIDRTKNIINRVKVINRAVRIPNNSYYIPPLNEYDYQNIPNTTQYDNIIFVNKPRRQNIAYRNQIRNSDYEIEVSPYKYQKYITTNNQKIKDNYRFYESQHLGNANNYKKVNVLKRTPKKIKLVKYITKNPNRYLSPNPKTSYLKRIKNYEEIPVYAQNVSPCQIKRNLFGKKARNDYVNITNDNIRDTVVNNYYVIDDENQIPEVNLVRSIPICNRCGGLIINNYDNYRCTYIGNNNLRANRYYQSSIHP